MKNEQETNNIFRKSIFDANGWAYKIPDPGASEALTAVPRPFDGFSVLNGELLCWEGKFLNKMSSFNLQTIKDHQIENLLAIKNLSNTAECWIVLGVNVARGDNRIYIFKDIHDINKRREAKQNFLKKELESLPYYKVFKNSIDLSNLTNYTES